MFPEKCVKWFKILWWNTFLWTCIPWDHTIISGGCEKEIGSFVESRFCIKIFSKFSELFVKRWMRMAKEILYINWNSMSNLLWLNSYHFDGNMGFSYMFIYIPPCSYIPCGRYSTQSNFDVTSYRIYKKNVAFWNHNNLRRVQLLNSIHVRNNTPYCIQRNW